MQRVVKNIGSSIAGKGNDAKITSPTNIKENTNIDEKYMVRGSDMNAPEERVRVRI